MLLTKLRLLNRWDCVFYLQNFFVEVRKNQNKENKINLTFCNANSDNPRQATKIRSDLHYFPPTDKIWKGSLPPFLRQKNFFSPKKLRITSSLGRKLDLVTIIALYNNKTFAKNYTSFERYRGNTRWLMTFLHLIKVIRFWILSRKSSRIRVFYGFF